MQAIFDANSKECGDNDIMYLKQLWYVYIVCDYTKEKHMIIFMEYGKVNRHANLGWK